MIEEKLKKIYQLMEELQDKKYKEQYNKLLEINKNIGSFEDFVKRENEVYENIEVNQEKLNDVFLERNSIKKENITIDIYLIHYNHIEPVQLDENYRPLPINEKEVFEYGSVITFNIKDGQYSINGLFSGIEKDKINATIKYNELKEKIYTSSQDEIINLIEKEIKNS